MLVDDNPDDNFFHTRVIKKNLPDATIIVKTDGLQALEYLKNRKPEEPQPEIIFLDINMPVMNGWDFLNEYEELDKEIKGKVVVIMLTTSEHPDDIRRARERGVPLEFKNKPLTREMLMKVLESYS